jgi:hypothetical protein
MSGDHPASRHGPPDFGRKAVTAELGLFHDRRHRATQFGPVLVGDLLRGDHQDRNASRIGLLAERCDDVETVYPGHHQIEHDDVRQLLPGGSDPVRYSLNAKFGVLVRMMIGIYWLWLVYVEGQSCAFVKFGVLDCGYAALSGLLLWRALGKKS